MVVFSGMLKKSLSLESGLLTSFTLNGDDDVVDVVVVDGDF